MSANQPDTSHDSRRIFSSADELMAGYSQYVHELHRRFPETYQKLTEFLDRGNCQCGVKNCPEEKACTCTEVGQICECKYEKCQCRWANAGSQCQSRTVQHVVRLYNITPNERHFSKFLNIDEFDASVETGPNGFKTLKDLFYKEWVEHRNNKKAEDYDDEESDVEEDPDWDESEKPCRLITINHLSANLAKLLGAAYDIPADFFNRHLPGTEPLSGRLISRLPSSVQIDFDELYESTEKFSEIWPPMATDTPDEKERVLAGHEIIRSTMDQNFLFREVGWDYFPVPKKDWDKSLHNSRLSSGYEITADKSLKNVFQFNVNHRISIYSQPPKRPRTAIIIFYPRLSVCGEPEHYPLLGTRRCDGHIRTANKHCKPIHFRGIPDTVGTMSSITMPESHHPVDGRATPEGPFSEVEYTRSNFQDTGYKTKYASAFDREFRMHLWDRLARREAARKTQDVNAARNFPGGVGTAKAKINGADTAKGPHRNYLGTFVHLFGAPLFKIVAANWARLAVRRSFDLDLLEWRPLDNINPETIEEIKSRRIAIARHQRDLAASLEVLRGLTQEERSQRISRRHQTHKQDHPTEMNLANLVDALTLALSETSADYNRARSNGFVTNASDVDSWERLFYDFFELKASMDALEKRADKIQDGMLGLMTNKLLADSKRQVDNTNELLETSKGQRNLTNKLLQQSTDLADAQIKSQKSSDALNNLVGIIGLGILVPFTVVGTVFQIDLDGGPSRHWWNFAIALVIAFIVAIPIYLYIIGTSEKPYRDVWPIVSIYNVGRRMKERAWKNHDRHTGNAIQEILPVSEHGVSTGAPSIQV